MKDNIIESALALTRGPLNDGEVSVLADKRTALESRKSRLLGCEKAAISAVNAEITEIDEQMHFMLPEHLRGYRIFDVKAFSLRDALGMPRLVPFNLDNSVWKAGYHSEGRRASYGQEIMHPRFTDALHRMVSSQFTDLVKKAKDFLKSNEKEGDAYFQTNFDGVIPDEARELILDAKNLKGVNEVFLGADCTGKVHFHDESRPIPKNIDPLILAHVPESHQIIVIGKFDPTTYENWIMGEHSA